MLARLGSWCFRNRWQTVFAWVGALVALGAIVSALGGARYLESFELPDSDSSRGIDVLGSEFGELMGGFESSIVVRSNSPVTSSVVQVPLEKLFERVAKLDGVAVSSPFEPGNQDFQISEDGRTAFARLTVNGDFDFTALATLGTQIRDEFPKIKGTQIYLAGEMFAEFEPPKSELIGLAFAIVVLIFAFGSVLAMGLPIAIAVAGVGVGAVVVMLASRLIDVPDLATTIGAMIGLGVGIDYALFIVTRYREQLHAGHEGEEACSIAIDTSGRAVIFAGITVVISLLGMLAIGLSFIGGMGIAAALTVAVTMVASVTLLPALLGFAGHRVELTRWRGLIAAGFVALGLLGVGLNFTPMVAAFGVAVAILVAGFFVAPLRAEVRQRRPKPAEQTLAYKWSHLIQRHPWSAMLAGVAVLLVVASPVLSLRLGSADAGNAPEDTDARRAYDLLSEGFGPGFNGPLIVTVRGVNMIAAGGIGGLLEGTDGVAQVVGPIPSNLQDLQASGLMEFMSGGAAGGAAGGTEAGAAGDPTAGGLLPSDPEELLAFDLSTLTSSEFAPLLPDNVEELLSPSALMFQVFPTTSPQDEATVALIERIRDEVVGEVGGVVDGAELHVTGNTAINVDFTTYLSERMVMFFSIVLALSFLLLMMVFRSILVPIKAVIMNLLSIGAAYGVVVAVFQWGWGSSLFGVSPAPIEPFIPVMMFAIVFGLSMDYEVFLLSRIKEEYDRSGDSRNSVADGLAATARVITAAAAIMVVVFGSFLFEDERVVKSFGVGLAVAVFLDATLVRMLLVPATMELLGDKNWWFPRWLDRILPRLNVEGPAHDLDVTHDA